MQTGVSGRQKNAITVVHHGNLLVAFRVGVGVGLGRLTVGGPTGVAQAGESLRDLGLVFRRETADLTHGLAELKLSGGIEDRNAGAIVPPIFQPLQTL